MNIQKGTAVENTGTATAVQLEAINAQAKTKLTAQQVYVFSLRLCDDQIDRDLERFDGAALPELAKMFVGKTGIIDHHWSSDGQVARIFQTQVVEELGIRYIKAWAYIRRGSRTEEIIADIEAGIKKEVSVGCAMGRAVCSVCGEAYGSCGHQKGEHYDGALCHVILKEPMDAYEFSFVAVPAQPAAGVIKGAAGGRRSLKELADRFGAQAEYRGLYVQAQLGREYEKQLQNQVIRLFLSLEMGVEEPVLRSITEKISVGELKELKKALEDRTAALFPVQTQLRHGQPREDVEKGFLI